MGQSLTKEGAGTLILSGDNDCSGGTAPSMKVRWCTPVRRHWAPVW
ncbi:autotransporter-associated beta strand repeat-containing protein [Salmonella enterica subsp. enterica]|nr:autotransporter-associated beta strand repeat-containing protein [Salmonella enterica subsp. enterica]